MRSKSWFTLLTALSLSIFVLSVPNSNVFPLGNSEQNTLSVQAALPQVSAAAVDTQADEPIVGLTFRTEGNLVTGQAIDFVAEITGGTNVRFRWDFGDGSAAGQGAEVSHAYPAKGIYNVTLIAENNVSIKTVTRQIDISKQPLPPPVITITGARQVDIPLTFAATIDTSARVLINWDFGDGQKQAPGASRVSHKYDSVGTFVVTAEVVNINDPTDRSSATEIITIIDQPIVGFAQAPFVAPGSKQEDGQPITFRMKVNTGTNVKYRWNFGDGSAVKTTNNPSVTHIYSAPGIFKVIVSAFNSVSNIDNALDDQLFVVIEPRLEELDQIPTVECVDAGAERKIYCFALVDKGEPATFRWNFGDGATALGRIVDHSYAEDGKYNVRVVVRNQHPTVNLADVMTVVEIAPKPPIGEGPTKEPLYVTVSPNPLSKTMTFFTLSEPVQGAANYVWSFGDGSNNKTAVGEESLGVFHEYSQPGQYVVTVTAVDVAGNAIEVINVRGNAVTSLDVPLLVNQTVRVPIVISPQ